MKKDDSFFGWLLVLFINLLFMYALLWAIIEFDKMIITPDWDVIKIHEDSKN